jgi:multimeric flavodoxin WrbA
MRKPYILGFAASNRSTLSVADEQILTEKISVELKEGNFDIHDPSSDGVSRSIELAGTLKKGIKAEALTNSEIGLIVALTAAKAQGAEVELLSLKNILRHPSKTISRISEKLAGCDGIILSSPVYFGDRSSMVQRFLELLYHHQDLADQIAGKVFSGVSVGAKRNGGQETLLIYQLLDFLELGVFGVGNDAKSTAQYGGTCTAGDIGTVLADEYGIFTSKGVGRRVAYTTKLLAHAQGYRLKDKLKIGFLILQDSGGMGKKLLADLIEPNLGAIEPHIFDIALSQVEPCRACKYCPPDFGKDSDYHCIIKADKDFFVKHHAQLVSMDAIVPVIVSPYDKRNFRSQYQSFVERMRYIRRSDYIFSNYPFMPLVFEEINANQNFHIRAITSFIRHEMIIMRPLVGIVQQLKLINPEYVNKTFIEFIEKSIKLTIGRFIIASNENCYSSYNPVGYTLKYDRDYSNDKLRIREESAKIRYLKLQESMLQRTEKIE